MRFTEVYMLQNFLIEQKRDNPDSNVTIWEASAKFKQYAAIVMADPMIAFYPERGALSRAPAWISFGYGDPCKFSRRSLKDANVIPNDYNDWAWFSTEHEAKDHAFPKPREIEVQFSGYKMVERMIDATFVINDAVIAELMVAGQGGRLSGDPFNRINAIKKLRDLAMQATGVRMELAVCKETIESLMAQGLLYAR